MERVRDDYFERFEQQLYRQVVDERLATAGFRFREDAGAPSNKSRRDAGAPSVLPRRPHRRWVRSSLNVAQGAKLLFLFGRETSG